MISDVITIKIKISNKELEIEEKTDLIISNLKGIIKQLEDTGGDIQQLKGRDEESSVEYVHLKHK